MVVVISGATGAGGYLLIWFKSMHFIREIKGIPVRENNLAKGGEVCVFRCPEAEALALVEKRTFSFDHCNGDVNEEEEHRGN
jgi:hypothetical protein